MTKKELDAIRTWFDAATPGMWYAIDNCVNSDIGGMEVLVAETGNSETADFIAASRCYILQLLDELEQVTAERDMLSEFDEFPCVRGRECPYMEKTGHPDPIFSLRCTNEAGGYASNKKQCWLEWAQREVAKRKEKA